MRTDLLDSASPGSDDRVIAYEVTFPDSGTYDLFARVRVGSNAWNDDSFFYAAGFGERGSTSASDWVMVNNLHAAGFTEPAHYVTGIWGVQGVLWKWVNLSEVDYGEVPVTFFVGPDDLTRIFLIGGRDDGLDIDKLAFGRAELYYTVENLDLGEPGSETLPGEEVTGPPLATGLEKFLGNI